MRSYLLKRLSQTALVFVLVSMFAFSIVYFAPGDPLYLYTSPSVSSHKLSDEQLKSMRDSLGLSGNIAERYVSWAGKMLQGDWGLSTSNHQPVKDQILSRLPNTVGLMGAALVLSVALAIPLGLLAGYFRNRLPDNVISLLTYIGISVPPFWFGIMLIILFALFAFNPLLGSGNPILVFAFLLLGLSLMGLTFGPMGALLPELFPTEVRYTGASFSYNVSSILGASVAPYIAAWLQTNYGLGAVGLYLAAMAGLTLIALLLTHETRHQSL